jgi:tetratricopeptide (TPR) repeat protein
VNAALPPGGRETDPASCPDAESLAVYIDGRTTPWQRASIEAHLARCEDCLFVLAETARQQQSAREDKKKPSERVRASRRRLAWMAGLAAAAAIVVAIVLPGRMVRSQGPGLQLAVSRFEAARGPYRTFEPRLTADSNYRVMAPATRSADAPIEPAADAERLAHAAQELEKAVRYDDSPAARAALGAMHLELGDARRAVDVLQSLPQSPDAGRLNDLAAAYLVRRAEGDTVRALEILERAVTLDPQCVQAWFNLALAAEAEGRTARAIDAWRRTLELDGTSGWSKEAGWHLQTLTGR